MTAGIGSITTQIAALQLNKPFTAPDLEQLRSSLSPIMPKDLCELICGYAREDMTVLFLKCLCIDFIADSGQRDEIDKSARLVGRNVTHMDLSRTAITLCLGLKFREGFFDRLVLRARKAYFPALCVITLPLIRVSVNTPIGALREPIIGSEGPELCRAGVVTTQLSPEARHELRAALSPEQPRVTVLLDCVSPNFRISVQTHAAASSAAVVFEANAAWPNGFLGEYRGPSSAKRNI